MCQAIPYSLLRAGEQDVEPSMRHDILGNKADDTSAVETAVPVTELSE